MPLSQALRICNKRLQDCGKTVSRALGLHVVVFLLRFLRYQLVGKGYTEKTKIAVRRSRTTALVRALIHIVPLGVAMWEIELNWNSYFVGYAVYDQAYYQIGAKAHEMAIVASLSAVIFSYVRYELMLGVGIPFGALFSGLQVSQASYLWSMEFWGSVCSKSVSWRRKLCLILVIAVSLFLGAVAGPSSAILLIPKLDYWPAGTTNIWLNVTSDNLWPARTNASDVPAQCLNANISDTGSFLCPSHGWEAIQNLLYTDAHLVDDKHSHPLTLLNEPGWVEVVAHGSLRRLMSGSAAFVPKGYSAYTTVGSAQQSAIAAALTVIGELWVNGMLNTSTKGHGSVLQRLDAVHTVKEGYFQPYTTGSCAVDAIDGPHDASPMSFPVPSGVREDTLDRIEINDTVLSGWPSLVCPGVTKDQIYGIPGSPEEFRLKWVELPQDPFNGSAIGAIILLPRSPANSTQDIMVCNLGAGWGSSIMNTSSDGNTPMTSIIDLSTTNTAIGDDLHTNYSSVYQLPPAEGKASNTVSAFFLPYFPQKPIVVTEDWARYLNPFVSAVNKTVIDILMSPEPGARPGPEGFISTAETALILLLANGLSNIGAASTLQGDIRTVKRPSGRRKIDGDYWFSAKGDMFVVDPQESKDWVQIRVHSTINGYAYTIRSAASKVAISFLLAYCVLALSHVLYAAISGKKLLGILVSEFIVDDLGVSSTCWDSIGEVTALAMNSTPTTLLRNTCAGIMELDIFKIPVRVLAVRDSEGDGEHLELVFGDVDEKEVRGTRIKPNRVYGTLPRMPQNEKSE